MREFYLKIEDIENLDKKLSGELPVTRDELIALINTHGRNSLSSYIESEKYNEVMVIKHNQLELKYLPLENLDVSQIKVFQDVFINSKFNGDLSKWNFNNALYTLNMFAYSEFNNDSLRNLDFKKIKNAICMFANSEFCGDISGWVNYQNTNLLHICSGNENFAMKYGLTNNITTSTEVKLWLDENLDKIREINTPKEDVIDYFNFDK